MIELANQVRKDTIEMIYRAGSGHPGGSLSCADLMAYLFKKELKGVFEDPNRDRFILSKGHACPALYSALSYKGYIEREELWTFRQVGSRLQGHPSVRHVPQCEISTGSLGQGFGVAVGTALGLWHRGSSARVYVMLGDGELQEGICYEAMMSAGHYGLSNLCAIVDYNRLQSDDFNENIMGLEPMYDKWKAFNWNCIAINGHNWQDIAIGFAKAKENTFQPSVIIAHTIKGKGVDFMERSPLWHGSVKLTKEQYKEAMRCLSG